MHGSCVTQLETKQNYYETKAYYCYFQSAYMAGSKL